MKNYSNHFIHKPDPVIKQSTQRRKEIQDFISAIARRVQIQQTYARNLFNVGKSMEKYAKAQTISSLAFSAFQLSNENRALQAYAFSKSMKDQVLKRLRDIQYDQGNQSRSLEKLVKKTQQELNEHLDYAKKLKSRLRDIEKNYEQNLINNEVLWTSSASKQKKIKYKTKCSEMFKEISEYQENYKKAEAKYNSYREKYYKQMQHFLETLQNHELQRIQMQIDSVMKILIFQTSMIKNFEYDINKITKQMDQKDISTDILYFINHNQVSCNNTIYENINHCEQRPLFLEAVYQAITFIKLKQNLEFEKSKSINAFLEMKIKGEKIQQIEGIQNQTLRGFNKITGIVQQCFRGESLKQQEMQEYKELIQNENNRHLICKYLLEYQIHFKFQLKQAFFEKIYQVLLQTLLKCIYKKDIFLTHKLIKLTFRTYYQSNIKHPLPNQTSKVKVFMFTKFINREQLKSEDLWLALIYSSIQTQLYLNQDKIKNQQEFQMSQKSKILCQLAQFLHNIIHFGIQIKFVKKIIQRFCKVYRLDQNQKKKISKCLMETYKQYKQKYNCEDLSTDAKSHEGESFLFN